MVKLSRICYMGAYEPAYARNSILRQGLQENGVEVIECRIPPETPLWKRNISLLKKYLSIAHDFDVIFVAEMNQVVVPLAWLFSRLTGKKLVFDIFYSLYDSYVYDRKLVSERSWKARFFYGMDWLGLRLADLVLSDTCEHAEFYIKEFGLCRENVHPIYIGCDASFFEVQKGARKKSDLFTVTFVGTFIPLHGIEYILRAVKLLENRAGIRFEFVGKGQTYNEMLRLAEELQLRNCTFLGSVSQKEVQNILTQSDACLGIFGNTEKTRRVIPNKVYEYLAMKKAVITGDTPAIREVFQDVKQLFLCPTADEAGLAEAIWRLKEDSALRERIAIQGYRFVRERFSPKVLGKQLKELLETVL